MIPTNGTPYSSSHPTVTGPGVDLYFQPHKIVRAATFPVNENCILIEQLFRRPRTHFWLLGEGVPDVTSSCACPPSFRWWKGIGVPVQPVAQLFWHVSVFFLSIQWVVRLHSKCELQYPFWSVLQWSGSECLPVCRCQFPCNPHHVGRFVVVFLAARFQHEVMHFVAISAISAGIHHTFGLGHTPRPMGGAVGVSQRGSNVGYFSTRAILGLTTSTVDFCGGNLVEAVRFSEVTRTW